MAQLFLTNPVIIFHPPMYSRGRPPSTASIQRFRTTGTYFCAANFSDDFFSARTRAHVRGPRVFPFPPSLSFLSLALSVLFFLHNCVPPPRDNTSETRERSRVNLVSIPDSKRKFREDVIRNPYRPLLRFKQVARRRDKF